MNVLVLGGAGMQGKAVLHDLSRSAEVKEIICADANLDAILPFQSFLAMEKIKFVKLDARDEKALASLMRQAIDVVIDMLPVDFAAIIAGAAVEAGVNLVNTMYAYNLPDDIGLRAKEKGIIIMPESGLDPGIDLVLCGYGVSQLDKVYELHSSCGGIPELDACDNPLNYKITWIWNGVLLSYKRPGRMVKEKKIIDIQASEQHASTNIEFIDFPGVGKLESIPNGDALVFAKLLGIEDTVQYTTRRTLRWPGHSAIWKTLADLGFLSDEPVPGLPFNITPHEFMKAHLEPRLQYKRDERDLVIMRNVISGVKSGRRARITYDILDQRDPVTGLFAMNRTVGYTASIVAQMVVKGEIKGRGLLTPVRDIPYESFLREIESRGIQIREKVEFESTIESNDTGKNVKNTER